MTENINIRQDALPNEMRVLLRDYPREAWPDHPNFAASIQNWMGAHKGFRQLANIICKDSERFADKTISDQDFAGRLSYYGNILLRNLHGHHTWEDRAFFPELSAADDRFDTGLETLESDHELIDTILDQFKRRANRMVQLIQLDNKQARDQIGKLLDTSTTIKTFLTRHLGDEEELVVPILLHHKMRG